MVVFQDSCISDSTRPQVWEPSGRTTSVTGTPAAAAASANRLVLSAINRVDPTRALAIGIASALTALWCGYRLIWLIYTATTLSSIGWSPVSLVFPFVLWGVIGVVAAIAAVGFLNHYAKRTEPESRS
jgi:hypothetical protein